MTRLNHEELFYAFVVAIGSKGALPVGQGQPPACCLPTGGGQPWLGHLQVRLTMGRPLQRWSAAARATGKGNRPQGLPLARADACKCCCQQGWPLVKATGSMGSACRVALSVGKAPARKGDRPRAVAVARG
ncbi:hypothetical protein BHE74_00059166 [Ensete ventricosum]|nr:hypothetical protein BHE74_00059166 [Ensete ventricosum]